MPTKSQDPRPAFGREVRRRRIAERWTIEQLAERAGISMNYLGAIERGLRDPSVSVIQAIAGALGVTVGDLLGGEVKPLTPAGLEMARMFDEAPQGVQDGLLQVLRHAVLRRGLQARPRARRS